MSFVPFPDGPDVPGAIVVPAHISNVMGPKRGRARVLVLHTPEEEADHIEVTPYYFQRPGVEASTNYYTSAPEGDLYQMVPSTYAPIANGVAPGKPYPYGCDPTVNLNYQSESNEVEGYAATIVRTMPPGCPQWRTVVRWITRRAIANEIEIDRRHVIGHYEVSYKTCPGTMPLDQLVNDAQKERQMIYQRVEKLEESLGNLTKWVTGVDAALLNKIEALQGTVWKLAVTTKLHMDVTHAAEGVAGSEVGDLDGVIAEMQSLRTEIEGMRSLPADVERLKEILDQFADAILEE